MVNICLCMCWSWPSAKQITRGGTSPRCDFHGYSIQTCAPLVSANLGHLVCPGALARGALFEKGTLKFVPRASPAAGYLRSWGRCGWPTSQMWLANFADNPRRVLYVGYGIYSYFCDLVFTCFSKWARRVLLSIFDTTALDTLYAALSFRSVTPPLGLSFYSTAVFWG